MKKSGNGFTSVEIRVKRERDLDDEEEELISVPKSNKPSRLSTLIKAEKNDFSDLVEAHNAMVSPMQAIGLDPEYNDCDLVSTISGDCSSNTSNEPVDQQIVVYSSPTKGSTENRSSTESTPKRLCLVCGDVASGFHYGVASCEACKAFFKRTIQGNIEYQCPANNDCEINKRRRKACQACRFQKCLRMGMLKEGVRLDRVRGGRQKYRRTPDTQSPIQMAITNLGVQTKRSPMENNKVVQALMNCEPDPYILSPASVNQGTFASLHAKNIALLSHLVDKDLVSTITWAKQIPGFTDLILNDQMRLLQTTWAEILSLSLAFRSQNTSSSSSNPPPPIQKLIFASDFVMDEQQATQCKADEMFGILLQLARRLAGLRLHKEEFLVLKALLLTNVDILLEDLPSVAKLRESLLVSLYDVVSSLRNQMECNITFGQILLCLPLLRQTDAAIRRFWIGVKKEGKVPMNKLFVEMLESSPTVR